ncbi:MAG: FHA domain-containing protein, partial [Myxococcota bacterium]
MTLTTVPLEQRASVGGRGYLLCFEGDTSHTFDLPESGEIVIGRSPGVDLQLRDSLVSRRHAQLQLSGDQARLVELGSRHGTRV